MAQVSRSMRSFDRLRAIALKTLCLGMAYLNALIPACYRHSGEIRNPESPRRRTTLPRPDYLDSGLRRKDDIRGLRPGKCSGPVDLLLHQPTPGQELSRWPSGGGCRGPGAACPVLPRRSALIVPPNSSLPVTQRLGRLHSPGNSGRFGKWP